MNLRREVETLSARLTAGDLDPAAELTRLLDAGEVDEATALLLAMLHAGRAPSTSEVKRLLPELDSETIFAVLAGRAEGDRLAMLTELLEEDAMGDENDALALFMAADVVGTESPVPERLVPLLERRLNRVIQSSTAIARVDDAAVLLLRDDPKGPSTASLKLREALAQQRTGPLMEVIPEKLEQHVPILPARAGPKVGRNDLCPCGSGQKFKKCHALNPEALSPQQSPKEQLREATRLLSPEGVRELRVQDLARLELAELRTLPLVEALYRFVDLRRWDKVERALSLLAERRDLPEKSTIDDYRLDVVHYAIDGDRVAVAERQLALVKDKSLIFPSDEIELGLLKQPSELLSKLNALADTGLLYPKHEYLAELAFLLLRRAPSLGIVVARGAISRERLSDAQTLLQSVKALRQQLNIKGTEPAEDLYRLYAKDPDAKRTERLARTAAFRDRKQVEAKAAEFRKGLEEATRRIEALQKQLEAAKVEVAGPQDPGDRPARDVEAEKRLRAKVEELKGLIAEGNRERAELRHALEQVTTETPRGASDTGDDDRDVESEEPGEESLDEGQRPVGLLFPEFSAAARTSLEELPLRISRAAIAKATALATGEPAAWGEAKRLQGVKELLSARIGIHHRMFFRLEPDVLRVEDVVHREGLMTALKRWK